MNEKPPTDDATAASSRQANDDGPPADTPDADNPQWTDADFARARPAAEALPPEVFAALVEAGKARKPASELSVLPQDDAAAATGPQQPATPRAARALSRPTPEQMNAPLDDDDAPLITEEWFATATWMVDGQPTTREHATQVLRDRLAASTAKQRTPEGQQQPVPTATASPLEQPPAVQTGEPPAGAPLPAPAAGSAWIDPDDAPEFTAEDFERAVWTHGDRVITREEGLAAWRAEIAVAKARRCAGYPLDSDDK